MESFVTLLFIFQKPTEELLKVGSHQIIFPGHEEVPVKVEVSAGALRTVTVI
jgi:hypothetical protein